MKRYASFLILLAGILLSSCISSSCPPDTVTYLSPPYPPEVVGQSPEPKVIELNGEQLMMDEIISGSVCNDTWSGEIYLTCDIQVPSWEKDPFFFTDCDLDIEEGAVIYVEAHNDDAYTEGCSCHE